MFERNFFPIMWFMYITVVLRCSLAVSAAAAAAAAALALNLLPRVWYKGTLLRWLISLWGVCCVHSCYGHSANEWWGKSIENRRSECTVRLSRSSSQLLNTRIGGRLIDLMWNLRESLYLDGSHLEVFNKCEMKAHPRMWACLCLSREWASRRENLFISKWKGQTMCKDNGGKNKGIKEKSLNCYSVNSVKRPQQGFIF